MVSCYVVVTRIWASEASGVIQAKGFVVVACTFACVLSCPVYEPL